MKIQEEQLTYDVGRITYEVVLNRGKTYKVVQDGRLSIYNINGGYVGPYCKAITAKDFLEDFRWYIGTPGTLKINETKFVSYKDIVEINILKEEPLIKKAIKITTYGIFKRADVYYVETT